MKTKPFLVDIQAIRDRARQHMEKGAVTEDYRAAHETVLKLLNDSLATEIVCVLRYKFHYLMLTGIHAPEVAQEFATHAQEEQAHADQIAERIIQLGGVPNLSPEGLLSRSYSEYSKAQNIKEMIEENLVAERVAIECYRSVIDYIGGDDPTTRRMLEDILAQEEEHAEDMASLLSGFKNNEPERKFL